MEVVFHEENTSNIVIGGGKSRAFSIANTAEFVSVLSDALYSHKNLAVVREVMCNAWDAHISAGITDHQIEVIITESTLSIRDFGKGISDDDIADIYCTYGESTKRQETATTGGFGLGSKSPFAISDFFTVTSFHNGTKTVYAVSKGSDDTDGLPELKTMVSIPTDQTGVMVEVPLDSSTTHEMYKWAKNVAKLGEMKVLVQYLDKITLIEGNEIGLKTSENGFTIVTANPGYLPSHDSAKIYVQYGAVVYSIDYHDELEPYYSNIYDTIISQPQISIPAINRGYLIIKAEDSTLSVAPSRETLSYSKQCLAALKVLLENVSKNFYSVDKSLISRAMIKSSEEFLSKETAPTNMSELSELISNFTEFRTSSHKYNETIPMIVRPYINTKKDLMNLFLAPRYRPNRIEFSTIYQKQLLKYVKQLNKPKWYKISKKLVYTSKRKRKDTIKTYRNDFFKEAYKYFGKDVDKYCRVYYSSYSGFKINHSRSEFYSDYCGYAAFDVFISNNISSIRNYMKDADYKDYNIDDRFLNCVVISKAQKKYDWDEAAKLFEKFGYRVHRVDLMTKFQPIKAPKSTSSSSVGKRKGYTLLSDLLDGCRIRDKNLTDLTRIDNPEAVATVQIRKFDRSIRMLSRDTLDSVVRLFPNTAVVSTDTAAQNAKIKLKIPDIYTAILNLLMKHSTDSKFIDFLARRGISRLYANPAFITYKSLYDIPEIRKEFNLDIKDHYDEKYQDIGVLWDNYSHRMPRTEYVSVQNEVEKVKNNVFDSLNFYNDIRDKRHLIEIINYTKINDFTDKNDRKLLIDALKLIMKG